jgi:hypothetical protein
MMNRTDSIPCFLQALNYVQKLSGVLTAINENPEACLSDLARKVSGHRLNWLRALILLSMQLAKPY